MITNHTITYPPIKSKLVSHSETDYTLIIEPLLPGYGSTLGNSFRRIMINSIPGFGVTRVRINDLTHEYQAIKGVKEDAMEVLLNLKKLRCKILTDDDSVVLTLKKNSQGDVIASDFEKNSQVEIKNPDLYIASLEKGSTLDIEVEIQRGYGYTPVEKLNLSSSKNSQDILVDTLFSPITNVSFEVSNVRVGEDTNYDKISISFRTDGTIVATDVVTYALNLAQQLFANIASSFEIAKESVEFASVSGANANDSADVENTSSDDIKIGARIKATLLKNGISTNEQLIARQNEIESLEGIGPTALKTINDYIKSLK